MWTSEEESRLRQLGLSPSRNPPDRLVTLARYFKEDGTLFAVTEGAGPARVSRDLARKVRGLTQAGKLDWLLQKTPALGASGAEGTAEASPLSIEVVGTPQLRQNARFVGDEHPETTVAATLILRPQRAMMVRDLRVVNVDTGETKEAVWNLSSDYPTDRWHDGFELRSGDRFTETFTLFQQPRRVRFELVAAGKVCRSETIDLTSASPPQ